MFGDVIDDEMRLNEYGRIAEAEWLNTEKIRQNIILDEYVIMPNHIHGIVEIAGTVGATGPVAPTKSTLKANTLGSIVGQFKSVTTKRIRKIGLTNFRWQRNYYDHIIRNDNELKAIREYIMLNPLRWDLDWENPAKVKKRRRME